MENSQSSSPCRVLITVLAMLVLLTPASPAAFVRRHHIDITREVLGESSMTRTIEGHITQLPVFMDGRGQPSSLVGGQRVHRVDDDRLYALPAAVSEAVIENRVEEALGLAGPCARGDEG